VGQQHHCPICDAELPYMSRYPNYVCQSCAAKATDQAGRKLKFFNTHAGGGFKAVYAGSEDEHPGHECFIDGRRCHAGEAYMGGTVVETVDVSKD
jgi:hypothetical protein